MESLSHHDITTLLLAVAVLLSVARGLGELAQRFHQPSVLGEILAGILLGPTVLGALLPELQGSLFPTTGPVAISLSSLTTIAITLFLMVAGMEVDISTVWRQGKAALLVGIMGIIFPFVVGFVPAWYYPELLGAEPGSDTLVFALFLATAMSITALPVIAKILLDLNLFRTELGTTIVAAAIFNDLFGWIIFAMVLAMMSGGTESTPVWQTCVLTLVFAGLMLTVGRWLVNRSLPWIQAHTGWPSGVMAFAITCTLLSAAYTEYIGVHAIFGAFLFGVALGDSSHLRQRTRTTIDHFVSFIFAPLFFASIGLQVDFVSNFDLGLTTLVLVLATVGKVIGCTYAAKLSGFGTQEARAIGFGMNARGAMEIILGLLALEAGIIGNKLFVALVIMALLTSMTSGIAIQRLFKRERASRFMDYLTAEGFVAKFRPSSRVDALTSLTELAAKQAQIDPEEAIAAILQRDRIITSALGNGIAVPHARVASLREPSVAVGLLHSSVDFDPPDGVPVKIVVLILMPNEHIELNVGLLQDANSRFADPSLAKILSERCETITQFRAALNVEQAKRSSH